MKSKQIRLQEIKSRLVSLTEDFVQYWAGEDVPYIDSRKAEFVSLHNEMRQLMGKEPRALRNG